MSFIFCVNNKSCQSQLILAWETTYIKAYLNHLLNGFIIEITKAFIF